ncbi:hypothetical protein TRFO_22831 [Tritrichomonas foetus]|uniref:protein-tyrosine-phosphatase n=1 Tax=Tritrichomonas foetus TaxID=1144522 RepID=A0A1J4KAX5_9EUKA|nr:hypothetical protein TRFO_22831 [Tritrichomonas foetus]|eukprot:OHT08575.1 hypothetical protein TRFO_22831 [Tritrichomonas foetus]
MGQSFSLEHNVCDEFEEAVNAIMLFRFDSNNFVPISSLDFIKSPSTFKSFPIIIVEPFDQAPNPSQRQTVKSFPAKEIDSNRAQILCENSQKITDTEIENKEKANTHNKNASSDHLNSNFNKTTRVERYSYYNVANSIHRLFKITQFQLPSYRLWILTSFSINHDENANLLNSCKRFNFSKFTSTVKISVNDIFDDIKDNNITNLSSALRPQNGNKRPNMINSLPAKILTTFQSNKPNLSNLLTINNTNNNQIASLSIDNNTTTNNTTNNNANNYNKKDGFIGLSKINTDMNETADDSSINILVSNLPSASNNTIDQVIPNLFISDERAARDQATLLKLGITHVVNINNGDSFVDKIPSLKYFSLIMDDSVFEELSVTFWNGLDFVRNAIDNGGIVLVHCRKGISRSAALCVAYIMSAQKLNFEEAYMYVKKQRSIVNINTGFSKQLKEWEIKEKVAVNSMEDSTINIEEIPKYDLTLKLPSAVSVY